MKSTKVLFVALKYFFLTFMALFAGVPLLQVYINTFRTDRDVKSMPIGLPDKMVFNNIPETWKVGGYATAYINSIFVGMIVIVIVLSIVGLAAYAISKLQFKGKNFFIAYFFVAISLPAFLYIVPVYFMFNRIGILDTRLSLIIVYVAMQIPFNMLLLRTFLAGIPRELEEAAKIDGCSELAVLVRITIPIAKTIFLTIALLIFVSTWNEYLWGNTFITTDSMKTIATRFVKFTGEYSSNMARIYTASAITITPVIVMYLAFSQKFIEGMTSGSVKG